MKLVNADVSSRDQVIKLEKKGFIYNIYKYRFLYILMLPGLLFFIIFRYLPMYGIQIAFKEYYPWSGIWQSPWIGFENFRMFFSTGAFGSILTNTLIITGLKLLFGFPAPLLLALMLNEISSTWFKRFAQTITYMPHFLSWIIVYGIVYGLMSQDFGVVNNFLASMGFNKIPFLIDVNFFRPMLVITTLWKTTGWGSIIYLAAISSIDPEIYDSAKVDGANRWQQTINITVPCILPTAAILLLLSIGRILYGDFEQILMFMGDSKLLATVGDIFETHVFNNGIKMGLYSYATAVGIFQSLFGMIMVVASNKVAKDKFGYTGLW